MHFKTQNIGILILIILFISGGCKKKSEAPVFTFLYSAVTLTTGGAGVQFFATCTNIDINMSKAIITYPPDSANVTFAFNGASFVKGQKFGLQDPNLAYTKKTGIWKINLTGNRKDDGVGFDISTTLTVN